MTDVNQITRRMMDGPRVLAAIHAERDTKHHGQEISSVTVKSMRDYHSILLMIILSFPCLKKKTHKSGQSKNKEMIVKRIKKPNSTLV